MRPRRQPTIKTLLVLTAGTAAYVVLLAKGANFLNFAHTPVVVRRFLIGQGIVFALWLCFGGSLILTARRRWRVFADCFGLRLATCLLSYLVYLGPPGLPYWRPPGTDLIARPPPMPLWVAKPAFWLMRFDSALNNLLNRFVSQPDSAAPTIDFAWPHATESFFLTSTLYGLFMYALALTCKEREKPSFTADAG